MEANSAYCVDTVFTWVFLGLFSIFSFFSNTFCRIKTLDFSRIRTQIVKVQVEHPDHLQQLLGAYNSIAFVVANYIGR